MTRAESLVVLAVAALTLLFVVAVSAPGGREDRTPAIEILGNRDLAAVGDTATWCMVHRSERGTWALGNIALLVTAVSPDAVDAGEFSRDIHTRCAPLLRARGLPLDLPLVPVQWTTAARTPIT